MAREPVVGRTEKKKKRGAGAGERRPQAAGLGPVRASNWGGGAPPGAPRSNKEEWETEHGGGRRSRQAFRQLYRTMYHPSE